MRWRPGHLILILFQALWLNVVVPGHTRGSVKMLGACCPSSCTVQVTDTGCCPGHDGQHPAPPNKGACAICSFAAHLSIPPAIVCPPERPMPVAVLPPERAESLIARVTLLPFDSCGPPAYV